jgi:hypothetical protein
MNYILYGSLEDLGPPKPEHDKKTLQNQSQQVILCAVGLNTDKDKDVLYPTRFS